MHIHDDDLDTSSSGSGSGSGNSTPSRTPTRKHRHPQQERLLDLMVAVHEEKTWTTEDLLGHAMTFLIAGHETTSTMLTWTLLELGEHPQILAKLREEIDGVLDGRAHAHTQTDITASDIDQMPFLRCIFKESMRLHPPVYLFSRRTLKDIEVGGYQIPAGWHVGVSTYALHRSPDLWERPDEFWPERWEVEEKKGLNVNGKVGVAACTVSRCEGGGFGISPPRTHTHTHIHTATSTSSSSSSPLGGAPAFPTSFHGRSTKDHKTTTTRTSTTSLSSYPSIITTASSTSSTLTNPPTYKQNGPLKSPFQYVPFSSGPRNCVGQHFARMEASIILARLLRDWDFTLIDNTHTITPLELLTVRPDRLLCKLTPRVHVSVGGGEGVGGQAAAGLP